MDIAVGVWLWLCGCGYVLGWRGLAIVVGVWLGLGEGLRSAMFQLSVDWSLVAGVVSGANHCTALKKGAIFKYFVCVFENA